MKATLATNVRNLESINKSSIAKIKRSIKDLNKLDSNISSLEESLNNSKDNNKTTVFSQIEEKMNLNIQKEIKNK